MEVDEAGAEHQPAPVDDLGRAGRRPGRLVALSHEVDRAATDADGALEGRGVAGVDRRAADEEVERSHDPASLRRRDQGASEADGGERHPGADDREDGAEPERAEQSRDEDDADEEADQPDRPDREVEEPLLLVLDGGGPRPAERRRGGAVREQEDAVEKRRRRRRDPPRRGGRPSPTGRRSTRRTSSAPRSGAWRTRTSGSVSVTTAIAPAMNVALA